MNLNIFDEKIDANDDVLNDEKYEKKIEQKKMKI